MQIRFAALVLACIFAGLFALALDTPSQAATTLPTKMNFQGRIANSAGNILANGTYNMRFRIWNASSGGAQQWSEDRLVSASQGVTVTNGQFSVQLGSITPLNASVFASNSLYFEVELPTPASATTSSPVWTEGAMTPRNQLATSAYAYNAETLDGIDSDSFAQLGAANLFTATNSVDTVSANAFQVKNGSTNLFNVSTATSQISIGMSDTTGVLLVLDTKTNVGDPTGTNGAMYYNSSLGKFRCYQTGAWADCITPAATLQSAYNASATPATITTTNGTKTFVLQAGTGFDSTSLFSTRDAAGVSLFSVDSVNGRVYVGNPIVDSTGTVLVLDTKNTSGDPAGVNGAMYYNSSQQKFRCYENSNWIDCTGSRKLLTTSDVVSTSTAFQDVTGLTMAVDANKTYIVDCHVVHTTVATTTGFMLSINGPSATNISYSTEIVYAAATSYYASQTAFDASLTNTTSTGTIRRPASLTGAFTTTAAGTFALRFRAEVGGSAITIHPNSFCDIQSVQ